MNHREHNLAQLAVKLSRRPGGVVTVATDAQVLQAISRSLHRIDEQDCNEGESARRNAREARLMETAGAIAAQYGLSIYHQGDPRGPALYLYDQKDLKGTIQAQYSDIGLAVTSQ